jgi:hypothetical protein
MRAINGCVLLTTKGITVQNDSAMKAMLHRIVAMLTRMAMKFDGVGESSAEYDADVDYEHRCAEHDHEHDTQRHARTIHCNRPAVTRFSVERPSVAAG